MPSFGWLHFSDLHCRRQDPWADRREALETDLTKLYALSGPWDLLFITGDLANEGKASEFAEADERLTRLLAHVVRLQGKSPSVFIVPGNHDIDRSVAGDWDFDDERREEFLKSLFDGSEPGSRRRKIVKEAFAAYETFAEGVFARQEIPRVNGRLPGDYTARLSCNGFELAIVGLNTTFLQLRGSGEPPGTVRKSRPRKPQGAEGAYWCGRQALCAEQWNRDLSEHCAGAHVRLLLTHHPPEWLCASSRTNLNSIADPGHCAAHFFGHMHGTELSRNQKLRSSYPPPQLLQAPSLFGSRPRADGSARANGYAAGRIEVRPELARGQRAGVRFWPRTVGAGGRLIPDYMGLHLEDYDHGTQHEPLTLKNPPVFDPSARDGELERQLNEHARQLPEGRSLYRDLPDLLEHLEKMAPISDLRLCGTVLHLTAEALLKKRNLFGKGATLHVVVPATSNKALMKVFASMQYGKEGTAVDVDDHSDALVRSLETLQQLRRYGVDVKCKSIDHFVGYRLVGVEVDDEQRGAMFVKEYSFRQPGDGGTFYGGMYSVYLRRQTSDAGSPSPDELKFHFYRQLFDSMFAAGKDV